MAISFSNAGSFNGVVDGPQILNNPTSLQFGPDGRLYVSEQNGSINAFTIELQDGEYVATAHELLVDGNGNEVVKNIQNHNDDGSLNGSANRQVTGIVVTEDSSGNVVLYISSSDPRISNNGEVNLDTNSGIVTRVTQNGNSWDTVDIIRGLPRSEENHATNGLDLSADGTKLFVQNGGNTNNGAPSTFFSNTSEYALSGTLLEIDLEAIADLEAQGLSSDADGGQGGVARNYIYDLPTLDDPNIANTGTTGDVGGEDAAGLDTNGPFGGNDGLNQAILPADAPLRIYADGFRNQFDVVVTEAGQLFTVDNGSNNNLGDNPITDANGDPTDAINNGGSGDPEPLFLITEGGFFGHPNPTRSNQDLEFFVFDNNGNLDTNLAVNTVPDLSALVPDSVDIEEGFIIDPSRFTGDADRLAESGVRVERSSNESNAIVNLGSSTNGITEFTSDVFDGALQGALVVTQFNGNITLLNINDAGTALEALVGPGADGILGTADDDTVDNDGLFSLSSAGSLPLDVTQGPDGTLFVANLGQGGGGANDGIVVLAPNEGEPPNDDNDFDDDGILNINDPFSRDDTNGGSVFVLPGQTLTYDFDPNQDGNLPGPSGFATGLTGVAINGTTDFEEFFQTESTRPNQLIQLDNVKFNTAAGGGANVIEFASNGDAFQNLNSGEFLFQTGVTVAPTVETFTVTWTLFNPGLSQMQGDGGFTGTFQQIGGFIGTGDQSNYLKVVAIQSGQGEIQIGIENNDVFTGSFIQANDLFTNQPINQNTITIELEVDPVNETATPTITYELPGGGTNTVGGIGNEINLAGTNLLEAINGNITVEGQSTGLAVGLFSTNNGEAVEDAFQAVFDGIEITATGDETTQVIARVNAGGPTIAANDGGLAFVTDVGQPFLVDAGTNTSGFIDVDPGPTVSASTPGAIFDTERFGAVEYEFTVDPGVYQVSIFAGNGFDGTSQAGQRVFDVAIEGQILSNLDSLDLSEQFGDDVGAQLTNIVTVTDGTLDIDFIPGVQNPLLNGIEIVQLGADPLPVVSVLNESQTVNEADGSVQISIASDSTIPNDESVTLNFTLSSGTAIAGEDVTLDPFIGATLENGVYTGQLTIAGGSADVQLPINIVNDDLLEISEAFTFEITQASTNVILGNSNATVTIQDDDDFPDRFVVAAFNAGGPTLTQTVNGEQIEFLADTIPGNLFNGGNTFTDGSTGDINDGNGEQTAFDGTVFDTERNTVNLNGNPLTYTIPVEAGENYTVELYFAEIFASAVGARVFDVEIEGNLVLDDFDILAANGDGDINTPIILEVPQLFDAASFGDPNALDITLTTVTDNAKLSGIVVRQEGVQPPDDPPVGAAQLAITPNGNLFASTFNDDSYLITNTGDLDIVQVDLDISSALLPNVVFDPDGVAGNDLGRELEFTTPGGTGASGSSFSDLDVSGGFQGLTITFDENIDAGFNAGETLGFTIDIDPTSIFGGDTGTLNSGADPNPFSVGAISGAELIGSSFTVTFSDDSTATGQLQSVGNQGGSQGQATTDATLVEPVLIVNGLNEGGVGTYDTAPTVTISGQAGETARVVLVQGVIQPGENNFDEPFFTQLNNQLNALFNEDFPSNTVFDVQTIDILLDGTVQDISSEFDVTQLVNGQNLNDGGFADTPEGQLPLGFVASLIDTNNNNLPISSVTDAIFLQFEPNIAPGLTVSIDPLSISENAGEATGTVTRNTGTDGDLEVTLASSDEGEATVPTTVTIPDGQDSVTFTISAQDDSELDGTQNVAITASATDFASGVAAVNVLDDEVDLASGQAELAINIGDSNLFGNSTFVGNSIQITNQSSDNVEITRIVIDLANTLIPETVFDPNTDPVTGEELPPAGDASNLNFTVNGETVGLETGDITVSFANPPGPGEPGFNQLILDFASGSFGVGDILSSSIDIDPLTAFSPLGGGAVSGQELAGGIFTVEFSNGTSAAASIAPEADGTSGATAVAIAGLDLGEPPILTFADGGTNPRLVGDEDLPIFVDAGIENANGTVRIFILDTAFYSEGGPIPPLQGNNLNAFSTAVDVMLNASGQFSGTIPLTQTDNATTDLDVNIGINAIAVAILDEEGNEGLFSNSITAQFDPDFVPGLVQAELAINIGDTNLFFDSTFAADSIQITNQSTSDVEINRIVIDLANTLIPDTVFDPMTDENGDPLPPAGDAVNQNFTFSAGSLGLLESDVTVSFGGAQNPGFNQLILDFVPGSFGSNDLLSFSIDIDPQTAFSPLGGGAVSGQELAGGTFTVEYSDGSTATSSIAPEADASSGATAVANAAQDLGAPPSLTFVDGSSDPQLVGEENLPILVDAGIENANGTARIFILDTAFYTEGEPIPPFQGNNLNAFATSVDVLLDANGQFSGTVPLTQTDNAGTTLDANIGINAIAAAVLDANGDEGLFSNSITARFDPDFVEGTVRIQAEDFEALGGTFENYFTEIQAAADGGESIRLLGSLNNGETGTASLTFTAGVIASQDIVPGTNDLTLQYFDESDGVGAIQLFINGIQVGDDIILNDDGGGAGAQASNLRQVTIEGLDIQEGDELEIVGTRDAGEATRLDFIELTPGIPSTPVISIADAGSVQESGDVGNTTLVFPVTFNTTPSTPVTVTYTVDISGVITTGLSQVFAANGSISVEVANDDIDNGTENVTVTLTDVTAGEADLGTTSATGSVTEDDAPIPLPVVSIADADPASVVENGDIGVTTLNFAVSFDTQPAAGVEVEYTVDINGVITTGLSQVFAANGSISVEVANDDIDNGTENVTVTLTGITNADATIGTATGIGAVIEDDAPIPLPVVSIEDAGTVVESGDAGVTTLNFAVSFDTPPAAGVEVEYTVDINGVTTTGLSQVFAANGSISVDVANDDIDNGTENVTVTLTGITNADATIVTATGVGAVTEDDADIIVPVDPIRIQAEDFDSFDTFFVSNANAADEGQVIQLPSPGSSGSATLNIDASTGIAPGLNTISLQVFDEGDGESTIQVLLNGDQIGDDIILDQDGGRNGAQAQNLRTIILPEVDVQLGDTLTILGARDAGEFVRIDYVEFASTVPADPTVSITDAGAVQETGDAGNTTLVFPVTFNTAPTTPVTVTYSVNNNGVVTTGLSQVFAANGSIAVDVENDDIDNGTENVTVTLTNVSAGTVLGTTVGTGAVTEDDAPIPPALVSIADAGAVQETGDVGVTTLNFAVNFDTQPTSDITLDYTVDINGEITNLSTTIPAIGGVIQVEVANDDLDNGTENVSVTLTGITAGDAVIDTSNDTGIGSVTEDDALIPNDPVRIQAEDFDSFDTFFVSNASNADEGQVIQLPSPGSSGTATLNIDASTGILFGNNDITLQVFDEGDGDSTIQVLLNGDQVGDDIILDQDGGSNGQQAQNLRTITIPNIDIQAGDILTLEGARDRGEFVRIDYVEFFQHDWSSSQALEAPTFDFSGLDNTAQPQLATLFQAASNDTNEVIDLMPALQASAIEPEEEDMAMSQMNEAVELF